MTLPPAPAAIPPARTPNCPRLTYPDTDALLAALPAADYDCAEEIAAALRPRAEPALVDALLVWAARGDNNRIRRNAVRALGRLAESPRSSRAAAIARRLRAAPIQAAMVELLTRERDNFLLQDAIWILDSFFFPSDGAAPALERIAHDAALAPALRARAAAARARLIYPRPGPLADFDLRFIQSGLASDDPGVRAAAALAVARLRDPQLTPGLRAELAATLDSAWAAEPPLALPADRPASPTRTAPAFEESTATALTARAGIARARDRLLGGGHLEALKEAYERLALPNSLAGDGLLLRSGLPAETLPFFVARLELARTAFAEFVGPDLAVPIPGEAPGSLTVLIFANQAIYRDYMRAFTPFTVDLDGLYDAASATLYTHQREPAQSENSLEETLQHELAHHLTAGHLFPGAWTTPGYHAEPKGWADEGLAEALAGLQPAAEGFSLSMRPRQLARLCARAAPPALADLLTLRAGYDRFGRFDYDGAWALSFYLLRDHPAAARRIYAAYRDGSYTLAAWPRLAGAESLDAFEAGWHAAIRGWCGGR